MAGRDNREGAAGRRDPRDIVLLPTTFEGWKGGVKDTRRAGSGTERNDGGGKRTGKRKQQIGRSETATSLGEDVRVERSGVRGRARFTRMSKSGRINSVAGTRRLQ